jgi:hypothetical protein
MVVGICPPSRGFRSAVHRPITTLRQPLRALVPDSVTRQPKRFSRLSASPFSVRRRYGRCFRLLPGVSTREPPRFLLCAACARQQAGQLVKGAHEAAFGYRLRSRSESCRADLVSGRWILLTAGPGVG